jgi:hypothetical protein
MYLAQQSTASMGMFDKKAHRDEPEIKKKRKNTTPTFNSFNQEKKRDMGISFHKRILIFRYFGNA